MSRIITVAVDLEQDDAALQIEEGIKTLELLKPLTMEIIKRAIPAAPAAAVAPIVETPAAPAAAAPAVEIPAAPAAAATPAPPATAAPAAPEGIDVDSEGLPWDGRIHASSKTKLVKGNTWKLKRGTPPELVEEVKEELRITMLAHVPDIIEEPDASVIFGGNTEIPAAPELPETPMSFPEIVQIITERQTAGTLQQVDLETILSGYGLPNIGMLATRPDLIPTIAEELEAV